MFLVADGIMEKEILELLKAMQNDINSIKVDITKLDNKIDNLETNMNKRFDELNSDIANLVSKDIADGISKQISEVRTDIKFVKHKVQDTEEDVFAIQDHLKLIK